jgi:uncharacterized membrane protein YkvA (DUF1232 family)
MQKKFHIKRTAAELYRQFKKGRWMREAHHYVSDRDKMHDLLDILPRLFRHNALAPVLKDLMLLYYYAKDIWAGRYRDYNGKMLVLIVAVLIYVASPLDIIPDWIPGAGFLDDAALIGYVVHLADRELERYYHWTRRHRRPAENCDSDN